ncbi:MAG: hypothetical protein U5J98_06395 [Halobacteriales archaeon]|nr:hypothetical protein [Halobacteriales archaeon]
MADLEIHLRCTACEAYRAFERPKRGTNAVACADCGKRHSTDSLYPVDPDDPPSYDEPP